MTGNDEPKDSREDWVTDEETLNRVRAQMEQIKAAADGKNDFWSESQATSKIWTWRDLKSRRGKPVAYSISPGRNRGRILKIMLILFLLPLLLVFVLQMLRLIR